ncbi:hypothetical protein [Enterobacter kobei]|uniref:hypothetical protein n=1 Tax=Enterobacter kobei TaxID=208224 RepID=UPI003F572C59
MACDYCLLQGESRRYLMPIPGQNLVRPEGVSDMNSLAVTKVFFTRSRRRTALHRCGDQGEKNDPRVAAC